MAVDEDTYIHAWMESLKFVPEQESKLWKDGKTKDDSFRHFASDSTGKPRSFNVKNSMSGFIHGNV